MHVACSSRCVRLALEQTLHCADSPLLTVGAAYIFGCRTNLQGRGSAEQLSGVPHWQCWHGVLQVVQCKPVPHQVGPN